MNTFVSDHTAATLYIFSGLPGTGKTTLAQRLAAHIGATHLRIDTIEQALRDLCGVEVGGEGYRLAYRIAADNLRLGINVVADCCNPWQLTREEWADVARALELNYVNIETVCNDLLEHQHRIETRTNSIANLVLPDWQQVISRDYHPWTTSRIQLDTANRTVTESFQELLQQLQLASEPGA